MHSPNAALIDRDPAIAGLAVLLDGPAFTAALRAALPTAGIRAAQPRYVRYKPGANCTVAYTVATANGPVPVYARAYAAPLRGKLDHARQLAERPGALGPAGCVLEPLDIAVYSWPFDHELLTLPKIADERKRRRLIAAAVPDYPELQKAKLQTLRYKPERRYVGLLKSPTGMRAIVRLYAPDEYSAAHNAIRVSAPLGLRTPQMLGADAAAQLLLLEWLPGRTLTALLDEQPSTNAVVQSGAVLAMLHQAPPPDLPPNDPLAALEPAIAAIAALEPAEALRAAHMATAIAAALKLSHSPRRLIHGDMYSDQLLVHQQTVTMIDMDNATLGDPAADLGAWIAHRYRAGADPALISCQENALLDGYRAAGGQADGVATHIAANLLRLAAEPFRYCVPDWPAQLRRLLNHAEEYLHHAPLVM